MQSLSHRLAAFSMAQCYRLGWAYIKLGRNHCRRPSVTLALDQSVELRCIGLAAAHRPAPYPCIMHYTQHLASRL